MAKTTARKRGSRKNYPYKYSKRRYDRGREYAPLVGDFRSGASSLEMIEYNYPNEPGSMEEGIMGIPAWLLLLGGVVVAGILLKRSGSQ